MNSKAVSTLGISGDTHLGGDDYDKILLRILGKRLKEYGVCLSKFTKEYKEELLLRLEKYKKGDPMAYYQVSINTVDVDGVKHDLLVPLTKDDFKLAAEILFKKTSDIIDKLLAETKNNVDSIVLTGGSKLEQNQFYGAQGKLSRHSSWVMPENDVQIANSQVDFVPTDIIVWQDDGVGYYTNLIGLPGNTTVLTTGIDGVSIKLERSVGTVTKVTVINDTDTDLNVKVYRVGK